MTYSIEKSRINLWKNRGASVAMLYFFLLNMGQISGCWSELYPHQSSKKNLKL